MIFFLFFRETGFMNPCIAEKTDTPVWVVSVWLIIRGTVRSRIFRTLRAFYEKLRVLPTPQSAKADAPLRLLRRTHFCYAKTGFMNPCITAKKNGHDPLGCVRMTFYQGYGAFRKTSTADAVARSFLLTPDFAVGKSSFFRRFDETHFCFAKTGFMNHCIAEKTDTTR